MKEHKKGCTTSDILRGTRQQLFQNEEDPVVEVRTEAPITGQVRDDTDVELENSLHWNDENRVKQSLWYFASFTCALVNDLIEGRDMLEYWVMAVRLMTPIHPQFGRWVFGLGPPFTRNRDHKAVRAVGHLAW